MHYILDIINGRFRQKTFDDPEIVKEAEKVNRATNNKIDHMKIYTYDEAVNLVGHGRYSIGLLAVNCLILASMTMDMFGFSVVVFTSSCDFETGPEEEKILLSIPFVGFMVSAYGWGYIADTRGRQFVLKIAMWCSFVFSLLATISPDWKTLAVLKLISVMFYSCAQSVPYTWLGECCGQSFRNIYNIILTSCLVFVLSMYMALAYGILTQDWSINLLFIDYLPWRIYALSLTLPLGISAFCTHFFYESPKFLLNAGQEKTAVDILKRMWIRNGLQGDIFPVHKIILNEEGNINSSSKHLLRSLWEQTVPLFKRPLLFNSLKLYCIILVLFISNNTVVIWLPVISTEVFIKMNDNNAGQGLCYIIENSQSNVTRSCGYIANVPVIWAGFGQALSFLLIMLTTYKLLDTRRKLVMIIYLSFGCACAVIAMVSDILWLSAGAYVLIPASVGCSGLVQAYITDKYPTSCRGMASCLASVVGRIAGLLSINVLGLFVVSNCSAVGYTIIGIFLVGILSAILLPPDQRKKN